MQPFLRLRGSFAAAAAVIILCTAATTATTVVLGGTASAAPAPSGATAAPGAAAAAALTPGAPSYTADLTSDTSGSHWSGHQRISFTNTDAAQLSEVYLRLWGNGSTGCATTDQIRVDNVTGGTAGSLEVDCTALRITLPAPLAQGATGSVAFDLAVDVPSGADRFGHDGAYNFIGNALPVLALRDATGWHLDPYSPGGESFFTVVGDFAVALDHPTALRTPATGTSTERAGSTGRTITTATARQVRDFAWAAGPFSTSSTTTTGGVKVNTYWTSGISSSSAASIQSTAASALDAHSGRFGAYPYGEADLVLDNNFWFGGMEYPGFVLDVISSTAIVHELAHQWWYGIVGDDEYRTPWLDESFADYATDLYFNKTGTSCWSSVTWSSTAEAITDGMDYWNAHDSRYGTVVYTYGKCALHDLRRVLGTTAMAALLKDYAAAHWYGVSSTADFKAAAQAATSTDLTSFWTQHRIR
jgi:hypothetical protein